MKRLTPSLALAFCVTAMPTFAQDVRITTFKTDSTFALNGRDYTIARNQDTTATLQGDFSRTSRPCPEHCIQPMIAAPGVDTLGELEVLKFLETTVANGGGLLIDARTPDRFATGAVPGAVNVPHTTLGAENRYRADILRALGATDAPNDTFTFENAMSLVVYCDGPWSNTATQAIQNLIDAGYPTDIIHFYRGGMQSWNQLGLTVAQF